uniref:trypsin-like peptidase domain-containing protein n=1 Tax=uncultured Thiodictyon sp. TaxID=1846217 RepID=UPI0025F98D9E
WPYYVRSKGITEENCVFSRKSPLFLPKKAIQRPQAVVTVAKSDRLLGSKADFVALPLTQLTDVGIYPYDPHNPGPDIQVGPADAVSVVGFPFGITAGGAFGVWATGFLASEPDVNFNELPVVLIDCRSRQGQSGSPVLAYRSGGALAMRDGSSAIFTGPVQKFIGVYSGRINAESDLGIVWKAEAIAELVRTL